MYTNLIKRIDYSTQLSLEPIKQHLVVEHDEDDALIELYRDAAVEHVENVTRRTLPLSQYRMSLEEFSPCMELRAPPIRSITTVTYADSNGDRQVMPVSDLRVNTDYEWARITPKTSFPQGADVVLTVIAGYGKVPDGSLDAFPYTFPMVFEDGVDDYPMPNPLRLATLLLIAHWYENREEVVVGSSVAKIPVGVEALLFKYRNYKA